ncbi:hypothetical protein K488DRAFT_84509 [Vararia minispora EC-137]|uniref:Uncharacterized protein n=1 Tax=Vararia minispora EC-137 TaxID=1314806 RepID=A0ACB8QQR6_9AGAM|nr:hypothetical protein K488DRAFT_84509 [Vararia minispora EC-137]
MLDSAAAEPPVSEDLLLLLTPVLVGCILSYLLLGVSVVQLYIYHLSFPTDRRRIKLLVYFAFGVDVAHSVAVAATGYGILCIDWGRPTALNKDVTWWLSVVPIISCTLALLYQSFYAWKIYQLGRWWVVTPIVVLLALAQTGAAYAIGISSPSLKTLSELHRPITIVWLGGGSLTDLVRRICSFFSFHYLLAIPQIIMLSMFYLLYVKRTDAPMSPRASLIINRLIRLGVGTVRHSLSPTHKIFSFTYHEISWGSPS